MADLSSELTQTLQGIATSLGDGDWGSLAHNLKVQAYQQIADALLGKDKETVAKALVSALDDDKITNTEWRQILLAWAGSQTTDPTAQDILTAFSDGVLSSQEVTNIALKWSIRQTSGDLKAFLQHVATFSVTGLAQAALLTYIDKSGLKPDVIAAMKQAIATGTLRSNELLAVVIAWAASSAPADLSALIKQLPQANPEQIALAWLNSRLPVEERAILTAFLAKDWAALLSSILGALKLNLGDKLVKELAQGKIRDAAVEALTKLLAGASVEHADDLAAALVDLATGARQLFASVPESDAADILVTPGLIAFWRDIRVAIYAAQLIEKDFDVVPTIAQAQPHVFEMAAIRFTTPVAQLLASGANDGDREDFVSRLNATIDVQFAGRLGAPFTNNSDVIPPDFLQAGQGITCRTIFDSVAARTPQ